MKSWKWRLVSFVAAAVLGGCFPERVVWSPDGQLAIVLGEKESIHVCDANGVLSGPLGRTQMVSWFPDSKRVAAVRTEGLRSWKEIEPLLTEDARKAAKARAEEVYREVNEYKGDWEKFEPNALRGLKSQEISAALVRLRELHGPEVAAKTGKGKQLDDAKCDACVIQVLEASPAGLKESNVLLRTLDIILELRVSPTGGNFLYVLSENKGQTPYDNPLSLWVAPAAPGAAGMLVAEDVSQWPDWSPDGNQVAYAAAATGSTASRTNGHYDLRLGTISTRRVRGEDGRLLKELPGVKDLAGIAFGNLSVRVRWLRDGRIVFSSVKMSLPTTPGDMPRRGDLFAIVPNQATVARLLTREARDRMNDAMTQFFEVSPDGAKVSILGEKGRVYVVTLASGEVQTVQDKESNKDLLTVPTWRSAKELCFPVPAAGSLGRPEVVLWSDGTFRCISESWPDAVVKEFLGSAAK